MNTFFKTFCKSMIVACVTLTGLAGGAQAGRPEAPFIRDGHYTGEFSRGADAEVFIQRVRRKVKFGHQSLIEESIYGLVFRDDGGTDGRSGSVFRIEELPDGTQSWIELFQTSDHVLSSVTSLEPTYLGHTDQDDGIRLVPTAHGIKIGCEEEITATPSNKRFWRAIPAKGLELDDDYGIARPRSYTGTFTLDDRTYSGTFSLSPIAPGVYVLRAQSVDPEAADGRSLDQEITAVVASVFVKRYFILDALKRDRFELRFVRLTPGDVQCLYPEAVYEEQ